MVHIQGKKLGYIYKCTRTHAHTRVQTCTHMYALTHTHDYTVHAQTLRASSINSTIEKIHTYAHAHTLTHAHMHTLTCTQRHTRTHSHTHARTHIRVHTLLPTQRAHKLCGVVVSIGMLHIENTNICTRAFTHTRTRIHTHARAQTLRGSSIYRNADDSRLARVGCQRVNGQLALPG